MFDVLIILLLTLKVYVISFFNLFELLYTLLNRRLDVFVVCHSSFLFHSDCNSTSFETSDAVCLGNTLPGCVIRPLSIVFFRLSDSWEYVVLIIYQVMNCC